jgi:potassium-dependent mechanosensitive channel
MLGALLLVWLLHRTFAGVVERSWPQAEDNKPFFANLEPSVKRVLMPFFWVVILWIAIPIMRQSGLENDFLRIGASMAQAWIVINLISTALKDPLWSKTAAVIATIVVALYILRLLNPTIAVLDGIGIEIGTGRVTVFDVIKGAVLLVLLVWLATQVSKFVQARLGQSKNITPSMRTLLSQVIRLGSLFFAAVIALNAIGIGIGIDLTALAVFSGAVGVAIGFGLQAIFSNLMSGAIMLT